MLDNLTNALDFAYSAGIVKRGAGSEWVHIPFSLTPFALPDHQLSHLEKAIPLYNEMLWKVSLDWDFIAEHYHELSRTDGFVRQLIALKGKDQRQDIQLMLNRHDFFMTHPNPADHTTWQAKLVEMNTISVGYGYMAGLINQMQLYVLRHQEVSQRIVENEPLESIINAFDQALRLYDHPLACMLMVVQTDEKNRMDQRGLEYALWDNLGLPTLRYTLAEIASCGRLHEGHLWIDEQVAAFVYYRAGYNPDDYFHQDAWKGRELIEQSSAIQIPHLSLQLAGLKKMQHILTQKTHLQRYLQAEEITLLLDQSVANHDLLEELQTEAGPMKAWQAAVRDPFKWVLKPQREGGGHNFYGDSLKEHLLSISDTEKKAYILMERIKAIPHTSQQVKNSQIMEELCVSEIGGFGNMLCQHGKVLLNDYAGYLVRTKHMEANEGGVSVGMACLNNLALLHHE